MGKHCTQDMAACIQNCVDNYGDSWMATFCTLDCELTFAACVIRDFSRALQGEELAQASQVATKLEQVATAYQQAATSIRTKTTIGFALMHVQKKTGGSEPFYPEAKLLPSLVAAGAKLTVARAVTDKVIQDFRDGNSTADIRGYALGQLQPLDADTFVRFRNGVSTAKEGGTATSEKPC